MSTEKSESPFNRVVLIGNGFDKALDLNTSYSDFVLDHFKSILISAIHSGNPVETKLLKTGDINTILLEDKCVIIRKIEKIQNLKDLLDYTAKNVKITHKTNFFDTIVNEIIEFRWVDIEQEYYNRLIKIYHTYNDSKVRGKPNIKHLKDLNKEMTFLTVELEKYIIKIQDKSRIKYLDSAMYSLIDWCFDPPMFAQSKLIQNHNRKKAPAEVLFINFNYTQSVLKFLMNKDGNITRHIFIHGQVNSPKNPIIFGYGDDTNDEYFNMELTGENEFLKKIKSFQYPRTNNYHKILNFLSSSDFEVYIVGHSCGLSDRTLLKTIFEHKNCLAIKNFHYKGETEDFEKRMEISRHFTNKALFRERVMSFDNSAEIPQCK